MKKSTSSPRLYSRNEFLRGLSLSAAGSVLIQPLLSKLSAEVNGRAQRAHIFSGRFSLRTVLLLRRTLNKRVSREVLSVFLREF